MKLVITLIIITLIGWIALLTNNGSNTPGQVQALDNPTQYPGAVATITAWPTQTPVPTSTIGYEATAQMAQATADEARRVNAMVTAEHEQRIQAQLMLTAQYEQQIQEIYSWTITAALTSVPLTATQQAIINTQIIQEQAIVAAQMTATHQAPTQVAAMARAQTEVRYANFYKMAQIFGLFSVGAFCLAIVFFILRNPVVRSEPTEVDDVPEVRETVIQIKRDDGHGSISLQRQVVPCSPEQLTELAEKVLSGEKTLAINQWEGKDTQFTRPVIQQVRGWLQMNKYAISTGDGQLAPTPDGLDFLNEWLNTQRLPTEYGFRNDTKPAPMEVITTDDYGWHDLHRDGAS